MALPAIQRVWQDGFVWRWVSVTREDTVRGVALSRQEAEEAAVRGAVATAPREPIREDQGTPGARRIARYRRRVLDQE